MEARQFENLITAEEAAVVLGGVHKKTLMRKARSGEVPAFKFGRCWYFRLSVLDTWIELQSQSHRLCRTERT